MERTAKRRKTKICMVVPNAAVKGGIASVVNGYRGSALEKRFQICYVESYCDGSRWQKFGKAVAGYGAFIRHLLLQRPDVVHIHSSFGPSFYRKMPFIYLSRLFRIPVVNHIHGAEFDAFYTQASGSKRKLVDMVYRQCDRLLVLSEEWKKRMARIVPADKITVLENYCLIPAVPFDRGRDGRQVLFVGELGRRKGCYDMPAIWERVTAKVPSARLVMAGDGEMEPVRQGFARSGLLEHVTFPGWVRGQEKVRLFAESAVFLFPTYNEGMPMVVLEAMSYGLGIVTTTVGGIPGLIQDGTSGRLCRPGDVEGMAEAVIRLLEEDAVREAYGGTARKNAVQHYSLERHLEKLGRVYESVARKGRRA